MQSQIHSDVHPELRLQMLKDEAVSVVTEKFYRPLNEGDRHTHSSELLRTLDEVDEISAEAAQAAKDYRDSINAKMSHAKSLRSALRTGQIEVSGQLYGIADYTSNKMHYYADDGTWIRSRNLLPEERQHQLSFHKSA